MSLCFADLKLSAMDNYPDPEDEYDIMYAEEMEAMQDLDQEEPEDGEYQSKKYQK